MQIIDSACKLKIFAHLYQSAEFEGMTYFKIAYVEV